MNPNPTIEEIIIRTRKYLKLRRKTNSAEADAAIANKITYFIAFDNSDELLENSILDALSSITSSLDIPDGTPEEREALWMRIETLLRKLELDMTKIAGGGYRYVKRFDTIRDNPKKLKIATKASMAIRSYYSNDRLNSDPMAVFEYCMEIIGLADDGKLTKEAAATFVADSMWYDSIHFSPGIRAIVDDAEELELPGRYIEGDPDERWNNLKKLIANETPKITKNRHRKKDRFKEDAGILNNELIMTQPKTFHDDPNKFDQAIKATVRIRARYGLDKLKKDPKTVLEYCIEITKLADTGKLTQKEAAYLIAGTMFYESVDSNIDILAVILDAGDLELPDRFIDGDPQARWDRLKLWLQEELDKQTP
ncbi:MAG: hypothetical protein WCP56_03910 [Candidatus Saccharibacteria bacterium]